MAAGCCFYLQRRGGIYIQQILICVPPYRRHIYLIRRAQSTDTTFKAQHSMDNVNIYRERARMEGVLDMPTLCIGYLIVEYSTQISSLTDLHHTASHNKPTYRDCPYYIAFLSVYMYLLFIFLKLCP